jgi:predicted nucleic acid-binding protein
MLVVDASVAVRAAGVDQGFSRLLDPDLRAPALMWSEARAVLRQDMWRGLVRRDDAERAHERLERAPVERHADDGLGREAWRVADQLGWARTYDAEYVALARLLECPLVTLDLRLVRGAARLVRVTLPTEL